MRNRPIKAEPVCADIIERVRYRGRDQVEPDEFEALYASLLAHLRTHNSSIGRRLTVYQQTLLKQLARQHLIIKNLGDEIRGSRNRRATLLSLQARLMGATQRLARDLGITAFPLWGNTEELIKCEERITSRRRVKRELGITSDEIEEDGDEQSDD
jgi:hypothetical protein